MKFFEASDCKKITSVTKNIGCFEMGFCGIKNLEGKIRNHWDQNLEEHEKDSYLVIDLDVNFVPLSAAANRSGVFP